MPVRLTCAPMLFGLPYSFTPDTPVLTSTGLVSIADTQPGALVLAYHEGLGASTYYPVDALLAHEDPVVIELTIEGELVETTPEHPFFVEDKWVSVGKLVVGDKIWGAPRRPGAGLCRSDPY